MFFSKLSLASIAIGTLAVATIPTAFAGPILDSTVCESLDPNVHSYVPTNGCTGFYQCFGGNYFGQQDCHPPLLFNVQSKVCDFPENVDCPSDEIPNDGNCCFSSGSRNGCEVQTCEDKVCALDSFCCDNTWDWICRDIAVEECSCGAGCGGTTVTEVVPFKSSSKNMVFHLSVLPAEPGSTVKMTFSYTGDINSSNEVVRVFNTESTEMDFVGRLQKRRNRSCSTDEIVRYYDADTFNKWQNDGVVSFEFDASNNVDNVGGCDDEGTITLEYIGCEI